MESAENQAQPQSSNELNNESKLETSSSLSKTQTIALLNESIDRLEETIEKISKSSAGIPPSKSLDTLLATTQELEAAVTPTETKVSPTVAQTPSSQSSQPEAFQPVTPPPAVTQAGATDVDLNSPTQSPKSLKKSSKKNIGLITIAVTAVAIAIVTVFWVWTPPQLANLLPRAAENSRLSKPAPTGIVAAPPMAITTEPSETFSEDSIETIDSPPDNVGIVSDISAMDFPPEIEPVAEPIEDVVETVIPEVLTSTERPKKLKMVAIKPKLNFTPEQNLVAVLDTKVSELVGTYSQKLIREVLVDLPDSSLFVTVADDWYDLDRSQKDSLGNEILERARAFSFQKLELRDSSGTSVARNPIVGENIIILPNLEQ